MFWRPTFIFLIILSTLIDYFAARGMEKYALKSRGRKTFLILSLVSNLGILFLFKYFNFFSEIIGLITSNNFNAISLILPMGISFYTFQTLSYSIDVYRGERSAEKHLGYFALYVTFFPQLVAGPIERSTKLLPELKKINKYDYVRIVEGLKKMTWGFFKKLVIADNLAIAVNTVFSSSNQNTGLSYLIATIFFGFQIYSDFSGYSDIAIGSAKIMGIDLMENFKQPYFSKSLKEFWSRWHISLSTWFRDYLYIPIGGSRVVFFRRYLNILIVFVVSGLWHGASINFIIWGLIHGLYQVIENITFGFRKKVWPLNFLKPLRNTFGWILTMSIVFLSWVFFRAVDIYSAMNIITVIFEDLFSLKLINNIFDGLGLGLGLSYSIIIPTTFAIFILLITELKPSIKNPFGSLNTILILGILIILFVSLTSNSTEFIYFQF
jgi:D-alanyl-lipoteichoic acid acyltransferase DltB (MBOAT superfamily)